MKKLTQKQLEKKLEEYVSKEDAKKLGFWLAIYPQAEFDEEIEYYQSEEKNGFGTLVYDVNIFSIIEDLFYNGLDTEDIIRYYLGRYANSDVVASESGEGLMFLRA